MNAANLQGHRLVPRRPAAVPPRKGCYAAAPLISSPATSAACIER
jgi:hypothetical protein